MASQNPPLPLYSPPVVGEQCSVVGSRILAYNEDDQTVPVVFQRKYTVLKVLNYSRGPGCASTVSLCAWHTPASLNPSLPPLYKRPRYGEESQIVVVKSRLNGGLQRNEKKLTELKTLRDMPLHDNIIALYDFFFTFYDPPQLHLVLGNMEGNLYQLIRTRRGRALAGGLVSSITHQIALGLNHIHEHNYFHFNLCPENILVTSTGLYDYSEVAVSPNSNISSTASKQKDVIVKIKISGFNLACRKGSKAPDMHAGFSWYSSPEVMLGDTDYSTPVDMWAFGAIIGEALRLQPMFPGHEGPLQVVRIAEMLGAPPKFSCYDMNGQPADAGQWPVGHILAAKAGITFPKIQAQPLSSLFAPTTPASLVLMIRRLLMYDPQNRLTSKQCLEHAYFRETELYRTIPADYQVAS